MNVVNFVRWSSELPDPTALPNGSGIWLEWRNWDDFGWKLTFNAHVPIGGKWKSPGMLVLGLIDRTSGTPVSDTWAAMLSGSSRPDSQEALDLEWFGSMGRSLDYYQWFLDHDLEDLLVSIADLCMPGAPLERWKRFDVFDDAFLRGSSAEKIVTEAPAMIEKERPELMDLSFIYRFSINEGDPPVDLSVTFDPTVDLKRRVHVVVGPNGSGKTTLLFSLARDFARIQDESSSSRFVRAPKRMVSKQVLVSNSPYDHTRRPRLDNYRSYSFVGLEFAAHPWERTLPNQDSPPQVWAKWLLEQFPQPSDLLGQTRVRVKEPSTADLQLLQDERQDWSKVLDGIISPDTLANLIADPENVFHSLSAGQKSIVVVLAGLAARLDQESVVLMDEPEAHLHPHYLVLFSRAVHALLEARKSFAVIATHSPLVLRDVPADCVSVLWRDDLNRLRARGLGIQSMGATLPALSRDVFGVEPLVGNWVEQIRRLANTHGVEQLQTFFEPALEPEVVAILEHVVGGQQA